MPDTRHANADWSLPDPATWDAVKVAVLMDIRDELQRLNARIHCHETMSIPALLRRISRNTAKPRKRKKVANGK